MTSGGHAWDRHGPRTLPYLLAGAIFGLFAVSVVSRLRWNLKQLLEAAVLGQFVVRQVRPGLVGNSSCWWVPLGLPVAGLVGCVVGGLYTRISTLVYVHVR